MLPILFTNDEEEKTSSDSGHNSSSLHFSFETSSVFGYQTLSFIFTFTLLQYLSIWNICATFAWNLHNFTISYFSTNSNFYLHCVSYLSVLKVIFMSNSKFCWQCKNRLCHSAQNNSLKFDTSLQFPTCSDLFAEAPALSDRSFAPFPSDSSTPTDPLVVDMISFNGKPNPSTPKKRKKVDS